MDLIEARTNFADAVAAYCPKSGCDTPRSRDAVAALVLDQPCVLSTGSYHNVAALDAMSFINNARGDFIAYCAAWGAKREPETPAHAVLFNILDDLVGVNEAGRDLLAAADAHFSREYRALLLAAE